VTSEGVYWLYAATAAGAAGLYLLLPGGVRSARIAGTIVGCAALAGLLVLLGTAFAMAVGTAPYFAVFAAVAIFGAARVITHPRPVYSAVYFLMVVVAVAAMLVLLDAEFLAAVLVIVYAGAILVTYVFVIMLAQSAAGVRAAPYDVRAREPAAAVLVGFVLTASIAGVLAAPACPTAAAEGVGPRAGITAAGALGEGFAGGSRAELETATGNTANVGTEMLTRYVVALEVAGVLLLVAMVGGIAVARKRIVEKRPAAARPEPPLGQIGRQVPPF